MNLKYMLEVTVNHRQRTIVSNMILNSFTFVGTFQWVMDTHRPVVSDHIFILNWTHIAFAISTKLISSLSRHWST